MDSLNIVLRCDSRSVINRLWPYVYQALKDELLTSQEAADLLTDEIVNSIEVIKEV